MKTITQTQIETIMKLVYQGNVPVQFYDAIDKILKELPNAEDKSN